MNGYYAEKILTSQKLDLNFARKDFAQHGEKRRPLVANLKKKFNLLAKSDKKNHCHWLILDQLLKKLCQTIYFLLLFQQ